VIGHGTQVGGQFFCCAHCANHAVGQKVVDDRA
jgi:hypothetical protein